MPQDVFSLVGATVVLVVLLLSVMVARAATRRAAEQQLEIEAYARRQEESARFKSQLSELGLCLLQATTSREIATVFLSQAHRMLKVMQGLVYVVADDSTLKLAGSFGCAKPPPTEIRAGEGLLGQCAVDRQRKLLRMPDEPLAEIRSGLGATRPACVMLCPIMVNEALVGVLEMAFMQCVEEDLVERVEDMTHVLAVGLKIRGHQ